MARRRTSIQFSTVATVKLLFVAAFALASRGCTVGCEVSSDGASKSALPATGHLLSK